VSDVRPRLTDVAAHFPHYTDVVIAVEQVVLVLSRAWATAGAMRRLVCLECGIAQHYNQALLVLVRCGNGHMLFRDQLGQLWGRHRLGPCRLNGRVSGVVLKDGQWCGRRRMTYLRASCPARESLAMLGAPWAIRL
jgi:hypothetical protein